jgi:hypothetical protein
LVDSIVVCTHTRCVIEYSAITSTRVYKMHWILSMSYYYANSFLNINYIMLRCPDLLSLMKLGFDIRLHFILLIV